MRRLASSFAIWAMAISILAVPTLASAFSLTVMDPDLLKYEVLPDTTVGLVFNATLNGATVTTDNVYLEPRDGGPAIPASVQLGTTNQSNDTIYIVPDDDLPWGVPLRVVIDSDVEDGGGGKFDGTFPGAGVDWFTVNVPFDLARPDPDGGFTDLFVNSNVLIGFNPLDPEGTNPNKPWQIPGLNATGAWKFHTGRPEILVADIDNGLKNYHDPEVADRLFLNIGELPEPRIGDDPCGDYDCNGDGRISASDYAQDNRVSDGGLGYVDPERLIDAFADGKDDDNNGYVDDISGWDFLRDKNLPYGVDQFPEGTHSRLVAKAATAQADNGEGDKPGVCPDCSLLVVRVTDSVIGDIDLIAQGAQYAVDMGAKVMMVPLGSFDNSTFSQGVFTDAYENGTFTIAASGDEWGFHHLYPGAADDVTATHGVLPMPPVELIGPIGIDAIGFTESYCSNWGAHAEVTVPTGACTSESTGNGGGMAGLLFSYGLELGLDPPLSSEEVRQLMIMTVDDVANHCFTFTGGGCRKGWDIHWGYGRVNAERALMRLGVPELGIPETIPPAVRIVTPKWWSTFSPAEDPTLTVSGQISARGRPFKYRLEIALSADPDDNDFVKVDSGSSNGAPVDGVIGSFDLTQYWSMEDLRLPAMDAWDKSVTVRVRAWWDGPDGRVYGEHRKSIAVNLDDDPDTGWMPGLPRNLGHAGQGSAVLYDMDGDTDGKLEMVLGATTGVVEVYKLNDDDEWEMMTGFPVTLPEPPRPTGLGVAPPDGVAGSPAVADLFGDGVPIIVVNTFQGQIVAIWPDGENHSGGPFVDGFPVYSDMPDNDTSFQFGHGNYFAASPTIADLNGDGLKDIIAASYDQKVYAFQPVDEGPDGYADPVPGWPVLVDAAPGKVPPEKVCVNGIPDHILVSPSVAILDPDSDDPDIADYPSVIVGNAEMCDGWVYLHGIYHNGNDHSGSPYLPGWPALINGPLSDALPIPPLTVGETSAPAIYVRGDGAYISVAPILAKPNVVRYKDGETTVTEVGAGLSAGVSSHPAWGRMEADGEPWLHAPLGALAATIEDNFKLLNFANRSWSFGNWGEEDLSIYLDDIPLFYNPAIADLDGDGLNEVLAGGMGYVIYARNKNNVTAAGWPKYTQNSHLGTPAVADVDNDGLFEVLAPTLEGNLFGWQTTGPACGEDGYAAQWWSSHHDERNTGWLDHDTLPPSAPADLTVTPGAQSGQWELSVTAPGDDWKCGTAEGYEVRWFSETTGGHLTPDEFLEGTLLDPPTLVEGGQELTFTVDAPDAGSFAMRAVDDAGNYSLISPKVSTVPGDDDDDDDTGDDDTGDDDTT
ncbi:MAG: VCBS repeat-containing protein, partial [Deltaproteobacteria bacterium]|nr:VCBS repeat-containing protein [Deltaproteobacteria bacterium]